MDTPLRIAFLDSWRPSAFDGSGTAVGISGLTLALRDLGAPGLLRSGRSGAYPAFARKAKAYGLDVIGRRFLAVTQPLLWNERQAPARPEELDH